MAIKFVNRGPEDAGTPKRAKQADAPPVEREPNADTLTESVEPELTHPKPEKARGAEKPLQ